MPAADEPHGLRFASQHVANDNLRLQPLHRALQESEALEQRKRSTLAQPAEVDPFHRIGAGGIMCCAGRSRLGKHGHTIAGCVQLMCQLVSILGNAAGQLLDVLERCDFVHIAHIEARHIERQGLIATEERVNSPLAVDRAGEGPEEELIMTYNTQPAILTVS